ncbi:MAG: hypothetical protein JNN20_18600 [Betaproteobacteria bacterium]|nr:hypothetical protein [Betaproteobacteria bacterium]
MGEKLLLIPLQKVEGLPTIGRSTRVAKETLRFAWHVTSVLGIGIAVILFYYAGVPKLATDQIYVLRVLSLTCQASFVIAIVGSRARHPSWIVFLLVSILIWLGAS